MVELETLNNFCSNNFSVSSKIKLRAKNCWDTCVFTFSQHIREPLQAEVKEYLKKHAKLAYDESCRAWDFSVSSKIKKLRDEDC